MFRLTSSKEKAERGFADMLRAMGGYASSGLVVRGLSPLSPLLEDISRDFDTVDNLNEVV